MRNVRGWIGEGGEGREVAGVEGKKVGRKMGK